MEQEKTLIFLKPDCYENKVIGKVIAEIEKNDFEIVALKMVKLSKKQVEEFYAVHREKPFYDSLVEFVSRGPIIAIVLQGEDIVPRVRKMMGATDPEKAEEGTIRKKYATSIEVNVVHGSDSLENAEKEIAFFFPKYKLIKN